MKTRQKILNAALNVLMENGFHALTQTRVAEAAGVGQGHLTYHFPTRNDLLKAVIDESKLRMLDTKQADADGKFDFELIKEMLINNSLSGKFPRLMLALTVAADDDPTLPIWFAETDTATRQSIRMLLNSLQLDVDESELHLLRATVIGASLIHLQQNTEASERNARTVIDTAFKRLMQNTKPL